MEIRINGKIADVKVDDEKTVGEIMAGIENWLGNSGHRLSGLVIDGEAVTSSSTEQAFAKDIHTVKTLDIQTSSVADLSVMSLMNLLGDIDEYEGLDFENKSKFFNEWQQRAQARFIAEQIPDLFSFFSNTFSAKDYTAQTLRAITEERLREVENPADELKKIDRLINETCVLLVDLPLDIQTGKDAKAAQTIQIFSGVAEKIIRLSNQLYTQGLLKEDNPIYVLVKDFNGAVNQLIQAYEAHDTVLVGDLAEYELSPRLQELYKNILDNTIDAAAGPQ